MRIRSSLIILILSLSAKAQQYYPGPEWQTRTPSQVKMNPVLIDSAVRLAVRNENKVERDLRVAIYKAYEREPGFRIYGPTKERGPASGLIIKNGYIIAQWGDPGRADMTFSVAKSVLSTVAGLAVDQQLIKSVDDKVAAYSIDDHFSSPHNAKITWRHLLTQSSDWSGCLFNVCDWADRPPREGTIDDWKNRKLLEPGTVHEYNDVRVNLMAYALLQVFRRPLPQVLKEKIMDPIGASTTWRWYGYENSFVNVDGVMMQSVSGGGHFGGGMFINSYDQARFGLLFCRNGKWNNQQLISSGWIREAVKPSTPNPAYGFMWWTNATDDLKGVSKKVYYADGFGGNFIVVDEENDLVIVARWLDNAKFDQFVKTIEDAVIK